MTIQRTDLFVPLTTAATTAESREFRITVIPQAEPGPFTALEEDTGRRHPASPSGIHSARGGQGTGPVLQSGANAQSGGGGKFFPGKKSCEPQVLLQRDGDRITGIRIHCSCGQVMDLACDYGEAGRENKG